MPRTKCKWRAGTIVPCSPLLQSIEPGTPRLRRKGLFRLPGTQTMTIKSGDCTLSGCLVRFCPYCGTYIEENT